MQQIGKSVKNNSQSHLLQLVFKNHVDVERVLRHIKKLKDQKNQ